MGAHPLPPHSTPPAQGLKLQRKAPYAGEEEGTEKGPRGAGQGEDLNMT